LLEQAASELIHNEEPRADIGARAVRIGPVRDLIARAGAETHCAPVLEIGDEFALDDEKDVTLSAPMPRSI
jgi:hypothetical protein